MGGGYGGDPYQMESFICIVRQLSTRVLVLEHVEVSACRNQLCVCAVGSYVCVGVRGSCV